jgi:hypothetical protein
MLKKKMSPLKTSPKRKARKVQQLQLKRMKKLM